MINKLYKKITKCMIQSAHEWNTWFGFTYKGFEVGCIRYSYSDVESYRCEFTTADGVEYIVRSDLYGDAAVYRDHVLLVSYEMDDNGFYHEDLFDLCLKMALGTCLK